MTGRLSDLTAQIKEVAPESKSTHSIIYREMLASRKITPKFNSVLIDVVKVITHIKAHVTRNGPQNWLTCVTYSGCSTNSMCLLKENDCFRVGRQSSCIYGLTGVVVTARKRRFFGHVSCIRKDFGQA